MARRPALVTVDTLRALCRRLPAEVTEGATFAVVERTVTHRRGKLLLCDVPAERVDELVAELADLVGCECTVVQLDGGDVLVPEVRVDVDDVDRCTSDVTLSFKPRPPT